MTTDTRDVLVRLRADTAQYVAGMKVASSETSKGEQATQQYQARMAQWKAASTIAGAALIGLTAIMAKQSIAAASALNESSNAVAVTFGKNADAISELGQESARSLGLSTNEFNGLAVRFSAFANTIAGRGGDVAATMDEMTTRAADFASVMNLDVNQAAELFQSGLAGETEPLRKFGIDLSAAAVEAYAYANGIAAAGVELTESQKIQARYGSLLEQTNKAQGDFANTSDSLANAQRIMTAEWKNAQAALGEQLLPAASKAVGVFTDVLGVFNSLPGPVKGSALALTGVAGAALVVIPRILETKAALEQMAASSRVAQIGLTGLKTAAILTGSAIAVNLASQATGLDEFAQKSNEAGVSLEGAFRNAIDPAAVNAVLEPLSKLGAAIGGYESEFTIATNMVADFDAELSGMVSEGNLDAAAAKFRALEEQLAPYGITTEQIIDLMPLYTDAMAGGAGATDGLTGALKTAQGGTEDLTGATEDLIEQLDILRGNNLDVKATTDRFEASLDTLRKTVLENGKAFGKNTEAGRANRAMINDSVQSIQDHIDALLEDGKSSGKAASAARRMRGDLLDQIGVFGDARKKVKDYINAILDIPERQHTTLVITADTATFRGPDQARADGGLIYGTGGPRQDNIPIWASAGEYVIQASAVKALGTGYLDGLNAGRFADGGLVKPGASTYGAAMFAPGGASRTNHISVTGVAEQRIAQSIVAAQRQAELLGGEDL